MRSAPSPPPRFAEDLLALALPDDGWGEAVLGDLHEEHAAIARERGARLARLWYVGQVSRLGARHLGRSLIGPRPDGPKSPRKFLFIYIIIRELPIIGSKSQIIAVGLYIASGSVEILEHTISFALSLRPQNWMF